MINTINANHSLRVLFLRSSICFQGLYIDMPLLCCADTHLQDQGLVSKSIKDLVLPLTHFRSAILFSASAENLRYIIEAVFHHSLSEDRLASVMPKTTNAVANL